MLPHRDLKKYQPHPSRYPEETMVGVWDSGPTGTMQHLRSSVPLHECPPNQPPEHREAT